MTCAQPEFWQQRYRAGQTPWDMKGTPAVLADYLRGVSSSGSALVPGCGAAYEVRAFHDAGWDVVALDFAPAAVERARAVLGTLGALVRETDFFTGELGGPFDVVYDRAFLCSLPDDRWSDYAARVAAILRPRGVLLGLFVYGEEAEPPPYPLTRASASALFANDFVLSEDQAIAPENSLPMFAGKERWQVWRKR